MKFKPGLSSLLIVVAVGVSACATSYGRQNDPVRIYFRANADQASISCSGQATELPGNMNLRRGSNHDCVAKAPGYEDLSFRVWSKLSGEGFRYSTRLNWQKWSKWTLGLGHLLAWPIDLLSGAMKTPENDHYDLRLTPFAESSKTARVIDKTIDATRKIVSIPAEVAEETTGLVMNSVVKTPAEAIGLASDRQRKESEALLQGQAAAERLAPSK